MYYEKKRGRTDAVPARRYNLTRAVILASEGTLASESLRGPGTRTVANKHDAVALQQPVVLSGRL